MNKITTISIFMTILFVGSSTAFAQSSAELQSIDQASLQAQQVVELQAEQQVNEQQKMFLETSLQNQIDNTPGVTLAAEASELAQSERMNISNESNSTVKQAYECQLTFSTAGDESFPSHEMSIRGVGISKYLALQSLMEACAKVPGKTEYATNRSRCAEAIVLKYQVCAKSFLLNPDK